MSEPLSSHPKYRPDIDGLRAIAVISVVIFHAFPELLSGGFIGVDIFFVISGFLISTIIFESLQTQSFSFIEFYCRRIRRIFPALLVVISASFAFAWFVFLPAEFEQLGKHILGGAGFFSNLLLWSESGYFDKTAETKPLLHLWSLGIEEQFYIIWPLLLWAAYKLRFNWFVLTASVTALSFCLNLSMVYVDAVATFYSPVTRFWELSSGAVLAFFSMRRIPFASCVTANVNSFLGGVFVYSKIKQGVSLFSNNRSFIGLLAIVCGFVVINKAISFPGVWGLLPVLGACLIISAGPAAWLNRSLLSGKVIGWFGLISYPLYLWHWPLLSFARIIEGQAVDLTGRLVLIFVAVFFAWLTYILIEKAFRFGRYGYPKTLVLVCLMITVASIGYYVEAKNGLNYRGPNIVGKDGGWDGGSGVGLQSSCGLSQAYIGKLTCQSDPRQHVKYAQIGDSKALALFGGLVRSSHEHGRWLMIGSGTLGAPVPVISSDPIYRDYQEPIKLALKAIADNNDIEVVLLTFATRALFKLRNDVDIEDLATSPHYQSALSGLQNAIEQLKPTGKKIVILIDNPTLPHPEDCFQRTTSSDFLNLFLRHTLNQRCQLPLERHLELSKKYRQLLNEIESQNQGFVKLFDSTPFLCDEKRGLCETQHNGKLMYSGSDHVSDYAAGQIGKAINDYLAAKGG